MNSLNHTKHLLFLMHIIRLLVRPQYYSYFFYSILQKLKLIRFLHELQRKNYIIVLLAYKIRPYKQPVNLYFQKR
jgi:hypothetical protein